MFFIFSWQSRRQRALNCENSSCGKGYKLWETLVHGRVLCSDVISLVCTDKVIPFWIHKSCYMSNMSLPAQWSRIVETGMTDKHRDRTVLKARKRLVIFKWKMFSKKCLHLLKALLCGNFERETEIYRN